MIHMSFLVKLLSPRDVATAGAAATTAGVTACNKPKLKAAHSGTDVNVVVIQLSMAVIVALSHKSIIFQ